MKSFKKIGLFALLLSLILASCKNDDNVNPDPKTPAYDIPVKEIFASLTGTVFNEAGAALENATVEIGNTRVLTDENGVFFFTSLKMNEYGTLVKIGKPGYFLGAQMISPTAGQRSNTRIVLMAKNIIGTLAASAGGTLTANENSKITLPANGIITASGDSYSGEVSVAARWIDPTSEELGAIMPGDLRAIDESQEAVQLATFGMLAVELEGASGEALNIAEGSVAKLEFPVPTDLRADAPATIPLWYFDENTGYWLEEGEAVFDGEKYVGEVGHFSFWNCDAPFPVVKMDGTVVDLDGNPLADVYVNIKVNQSGYGRSGLTNAHGAFSGKIPKDEELTISVYLPGQCSGVLYTANIGPFGDDVVLPPIEVDLANAIFVKSLELTGQMENCAGELVTEGYLKVSDNEDQKSILWPDSAGMINGNILFCENATTLDLEGYDFDAEKKSNIVTMTIPAGSSLDFGTISVCEDLVENLNYSINGEDFSILDPSAVLDVDILIIRGFGVDSAGVTIQVMATDIGVYQPDYAEFSGMGASGNFPFAFCQGATAACSDFDVTISSFGAVGELIEGTFDGTMDAPNSGTSTVSGSFKAIRE